MATQSPLSVTNPEDPRVNPGQLSPADTANRVRAMNMSAEAGGNINLIPPGSNPNVVSSSDANAFVTNTQRQISPPSNPDGSSVTPYVVPSQKPVQQTGFDPIDPVGSLARQAYAGQKAKIETSFAPAEAAKQAGNLSETLSGQASEVYSNRAGTSYGFQELNNLALNHQQEIQSFQAEKQAALDRAWDASLRGAVGEVMQAQKERTDAEVKAQDAKVKYAKDAQEISAANQAIQKDVSSTITTFLKGGSIPTDQQLNLWDKTYNLDPGTSKTLLKAVQSDFSRSEAKYAVDQRNASVDSAKKITEYLDTQPLGSKITIGNSTYYGTGKGNMKSGIEVDKATGQGLYYEFHPETGQTITVPMGTVGYNDPNWTIEKDDEGNLWRVSAKTGETELLNAQKNTGLPPSSPAPVPTSEQRRIPFTPGAAQKTLNALRPEGSVGPTLPGHEYNAGQCGAYVNWACDTGIFGNTIQQKTEALKQFPPVKPEEIQTNNTFVMRTGTTGHIGFVGDVVHDPATGKITGFMANESNYVPPNAGKVSYSRFMSINDPRIVGFADIPTPNLPPSGSDSPYTDAASGNTTASSSGFGVFGGKKKDSKENEWLSPSEAKELGVAYGTTRGAAAKMNIVPGGTSGEDGKLITPSELKAYGLDPTNPKYANLTHGGLASALSEQQASKELKVPSFDEFALNFEQAAAKNGDIANINPSQLQQIYQKTVGASPSYIDAASNLAPKFAGENKGPAFIKDVRTAIENGDFNRAQDKLKKAALDTADATTGQQVRGRDATIRALSKLQTQLDEYVRKNGDTGIFSGKQEEIENKVGAVSNPEQKAIANAIKSALVDYRHAVSGAAFSESEKADYDSMFPSILNGSELNRANISGLRSALEGGNESFYRQQLGNENYDAIFGN